MHASGFASLDVSGPTVLRLARGYDGAVDELGEVLLEAGLPRGSPFL